MTTVVIELLKVKVAPQLREQYLQKDAEIWTQGLAKLTGFLSKEIWLNPHEPGEVILIIRWASREQWKSISNDVLKVLEQQFAAQMRDTYQIIESSEYQVRESREKTKVDNFLIEGST